jgi:hypothetical protein
MHQMKLKWLQREITKDWIGIGNGGPLHAVPLNPAEPDKNFLIYLDGMALHLGKERAILPTLIEDSLFFANIHNGDETTEDLHWRE